MRFVIIINTRVEGCLRVGYGHMSIGNPEVCPRRVNLGDGTAMHAVSVHRVERVRFALLDIFGNYELP